MTARPGEKTRQGPKFLTDFVSRHFIEGERRSMQERIVAVIPGSSDESDDASAES